MPRTAWPRDRSARQCRTYGHCCCRPGCPASTGTMRLHGLWRSEMWCLRSALASGPAHGFDSTASNLTSPAREHSDATRGYTFPRRNDGPASWGHRMSQVHPAYWWDTASAPGYTRSRPCTAKSSAAGHAGSTRREWSHACTSDQLMHSEQTLSSSWRLLPWSSTQQEPAPRTTQTCTGTRNAPQDCLG